MDSIENNVKKEPSDINEKPKSEKARRTEIFYGVSYTKEEINIIRQRIFELKLLTAKWIRQKVFAQP